MLSTSLSMLAAAGIFIGRAQAAPCDIYAAGGTPCVAAHSTTRALYRAYTGPLYQVLRAGDGATADIPPLRDPEAGGVSHSAVQDAFCARTTCLISIIYDQSGHGNDLRRAPHGHFLGPERDGSDHLASAIGAPVTLNGRRAYGVFIAPGSGYRNNAARGTAVDDQPQGMYAVLDGTHYNNMCCFDYGNAEVSGTDTGNGHMEAIYFGDNTIWGSGAGPGPWIMADLENGLFSGFSPKNNPGDPTITARFVTAAVKGRPDLWALRGADAQRVGPMSTYYSGIRPRGGYNPMSKEGAIVLGIGGDNSNSAQGTFYEGVMTTGYPSDATENAVQANIASARYATASPNFSAALDLDSSISIRSTSPCCDARYLANSANPNDDSITTQPVSASSPANLKSQASWTVRAGLANNACYSFESVHQPGSFLRHSHYQLVLNPNDGSKQFAEDATFCTMPSLNGTDAGHSFRSWNYPTRLLRQHNDKLYAASHGGAYDFDGADSYNKDASWEIGAPFV
ncbi:hypothetical protein E4U55_002572 [Claviceps digitariae]|nr:hypothetical protein E4U55_002572 [Claviceps digitariae]